MAAPPPPSTPAPIRAQTHGLGASPEAQAEAITATRPAAITRNSVTFPSFNAAPGRTEWPEASEPRTNVNRFPVSLRLNLSAKGDPGPSRPRTGGGTEPRHPVATGRRAD